MKRLLKSNWFLFTCSLLAAMLIWIYVVYEINPIFETTIKNVPINYIKYSEDFSNGKLAALSKSHETVNVKIKGKRGTLSKVKRESVYCNVNMSDVNVAGTHKIPISVSFDISGVELVSKDPYNVMVQVDKVVTRELDINVETKGTPADGYIYDSIEYATDKIRITGADSVVGKVKSAKISVDIAGKTDSQNGRYKILLMDKNGDEVSDEGISKNISYVELKCNILRLKELKVSPKLSDKVTYNGKKVTVDKISPDKIAVLGSKTLLSSVDEIETEEINVNRLKDGDTVKAKLSELPQNVKFEDEEIKEIEITFKVE